MFPLMIGVSAYIVVKIIWEHRARIIAIKRRDPLATAKTAGVYATANQSNGMTDVGFGDGSRRRITDAHTATHQETAGQIASARPDGLNALRTMTFSAVGAVAGFAFIWFLLSNPWPLTPEYFWNLISSAQHLFK
jgi:hypothetical protein